MPEKCAARINNISSLKMRMIEERDAWRSHGVDDGNGRLYQSTESYGKLKELCSEDELKEIDAEMQPWTRPQVRPEP